MLCLCTCFLTLLPLYISSTICRVEFFMLFRIKLIFQPFIHLLRRILHDCCFVNSVLDTSLGRDTPASVPICISLLANCSVVQFSFFVYLSWSRHAHDFFVAVPVTSAEVNNTSHASECVWRGFPRYRLKRHCLNGSILQNCLTKDSLTKTVEHRFSQNRKTF